MRKLAIITALGVLTISAHARADDAYQPSPDPETSRGPGFDSYAWSEPRLRSEIGVGLILGGGVTGFTDPAMRDATKTRVGGLWDVRASIGTHIPIGLDLSYLGTAVNLRSLEGQDNGTLLGSTVEAALRYNILPHFDWNPYIFAGAGWQRYDVMLPRLTTSDTGLVGRDNVAEFPMGAGLSYRNVSGLVIDLRGTFRATTDSSLLVEPNGDHASLHTWEASGALGYEF
jgi:opacity protein-like surface antigen